MSTGIDVRMHVISWAHYDVEGEDDGQELVIKAFGVGEDGRSMAVTVTGFRPFFYARAFKGGRPDRFLPDHVRQRVRSMRPVQLKEFHGFQNDEVRTMHRIETSSQGDLRSVAQYLLRNKSEVVQVYEGNVEPVIRFCHVRDIQPCGWIQVAAEHCEENTSLLTSSCSRDVVVRWQHVRSLARDAIAPLLVASFDIECTSSHGDFPVAIKSYHKLATEMYALFANAPAIRVQQLALARRCLETAFGCCSDDGEEQAGISRVHPKDQQRDPEQLRQMVNRHVDDVWGLLSRRAAVEVRYSKEADRKQGAVANILARRATIRVTPGDAEALQKRRQDQVIEDVDAKLSFSFPPLQGDPVIQVGTTFHRYGEAACHRRHVLTLGTCEAVEGAEVVACAHETELLLRWAALVRESDPDVVTGYNICGFDFAYLRDRARELGCEAEFSRLGRLQNVRCAFRETMLSSSALGDNVIKYYELDGRCVIDLMRVVRRDHSLDSYKLDHVASKFLKENKHDIGPGDIFRLQQGTAADRATVAAYCVQDCALCNRLMIRLETLANNVGMANVCRVPLAHIFMRGQGVKIFSLVAKQCADDGFAIPTRQPFAPGGGDEDDGYEGAIVLEPQTGMYMDEVIAVMDYASLYPSSIIGENLSHDTYVLDPRYDGLEGVEYQDICYDIYQGKGDERTKVGVKTCRFVVNREGVIPRILRRLLQARKDTRRRIGHKRVSSSGAGGGSQAAVGPVLREDDDELEVLDVASGERRVFRRGPGAELTVEDAHDAFAKAVLDGLQLAYKVTANSLYGQMGARTSPVYLKEIAACTTAVGRAMIMKAKAFMEERHAARVIYGDSVAGHTPCVLRVRGRRLHVERVEDLAGRFGGDRWLPCEEAGRQTKEACELPPSAGVEVWSDGGWTRVHRVIRHALAPHKRMVRVRTPSGIVDVTDDHSLLRADGRSVLSPRDAVPGTDLLHRPLDPGDLPPGAAEAVAAHMDALGVRPAPGSVFDAEDQLTAQRTYVALRALGCHVALSELLPSGAGGGVRLRVLAQPLAKADAAAVLEAPRCLPPSQDYVYDLTTDSAHFQAGAGCMVVHNTDSIFCIFPGEARGDLRAAMEASDAATREFNRLLKAPQNLEAEKCFYPFCLLSKKRYIGMMYEQGNHDKEGKRKEMGVALKRRDTAPIVKTIYSGAIDIIMKQRDLQGSVDFVRQVVDEVVDGRRPMSDFIITKSLRATYADPDRIAHRVLADRIGARDPGNRPQANDRVAYAYVVNPSARLQGDRIETPEYIEAKGLRLDYRHYITNQITKPVCQLYAIVLDQLPSEGSKRTTAAEWARLEAQLRREKATEKKARDRLDELREREVEEMLFAPALRRLDHQLSKEAKRDFFKVHFKKK